MTATVDTSLDDLYTSVGNFIQLVLGTDIPVEQGQANRVASPPVATDGGTPPSGFVQMQAFISKRTTTNQDSFDPVNQLLMAQSNSQVEVQLDFYGPLSKNWAEMVSTLWRDDYGCANLGPTCQPLHADEAIQSALVDGEEQYEERWMLKAYLQYNPVTTVGQQSATALAVVAKNVDVTFPA